MITYVVSSCLAGEACRYDGRSNENAFVRDLVLRGEALAVCPELLGGLGVPRDPCELQECAQGGYVPLGKRVISEHGQDVTKAFVLGAEQALKKAQAAGCTVAIIKSRSPSCGKSVVYDGTFSKQKVMGQGIWAYMLKEAGFTLYSEEDLPEEI